MFSQHDAVVLYVEIKFLKQLVHLLMSGIIIIMTIMMMIIKAYTPHITLHEPRFLFVILRDVQQQQQQQQQQAAVEIQE